MHFDFHFNTVQVLWTLTFASLLVLLVVLLGRGRDKRFPWFSASIVLVTLRLLANRILFGRLPQITMGAIFIVMADLTAIITLLVVAEMARAAFARAGRRFWLICGLIPVVIAGIVMWKWGPWPARNSLAFDTPMAKLQVLQLVAQKTALFADALIIGLGILVVLFGRRYGAGWRSHVQQIVIGLSTASLSQISAQVIWQRIVRTAGQPHSQAEYLRIVGLRDKLFNANSVVYIVVVIWWIVCLWMDEPGTVGPAVESVPEIDAGGGRSLSVKEPDKLES